MSDSPGLRHGHGPWSRGSSAGSIIILLYDFTQILFQVNVENLTEEQRKVVDFALVQLSGGEVCRSNLVRVENFSQQLVSGFRYKRPIT